MVLEKKEGAIIKEGAVYELDHKYRKKKRYMVLNHDCLVVYKSKGCSKALTVLLLGRQIRMYKDPACKKYYCFVLLNDKAFLRLGFDDKKEYTHWMAVVYDRIKRRKKQTERRSTASGSVNGEDSYYHDSGGAPYHVKSPRLGIPNRSASSKTVASQSGRSVEGMTYLSLSESFKRMRADDIDSDVVYNLKNQIKMQTTRSASIKDSGDDKPASFEGGQQQVDTLIHVVLTRLALQLDIDYGQNGGSYLYEPLT